MIQQLRVRLVLLKFLGLVLDPHCYWYLTNCWLEVEKASVICLRSVALAIICTYIAILRIPAYVRVRVP